MKTINLESYRPGAFLSVMLLILFTGSLPGGIYASQVDDTAIFWSISKNDEPAGYLLGTIHSEDPRVLDFPKALMETVASNQIFAMEMVPDLPTLRQLTEYMQYQDGTTLEEHIGAERFVRLQAALSDYNVPRDWVARMKVWAAMMTLSVPPPETGFFMDFSLSLRAAGAGLRVVGLETLEQQLSFLEEMPMEQQLVLLDQALSEYEKVADLHEQMVSSYLDGDLQALSEQTEEQLGQLGEQASQYFMVNGIELRNHRMMDSLLPLLETDRVFVAVGALHLPGTTGLIQLLRNHGYELQALSLPFSVEAPESNPEPRQQQRN